MQFSKISDMLWLSQVFVVARKSIDVGEICDVQIGIAKRI
jgi:hypothetical protein